MTMKYAVRLTDPENFTFGAESGSWDHVKGWLLHELRGCARESTTWTAPWPGRSAPS